MLEYTDSKNKNHESIINLYSELYCDEIVNPRNIANPSQLQWTNMVPVHYIFLQFHDMKY